MRSDLTKTVVTALFIAASVPASANHEGTWHAPDKQSTVDVFCHTLGDLAGETLESVCLVALE